MLCTFLQFKPTLIVDLGVRGSSPRGGTKFFNELEAFKMLRASHGNALGNGRPITSGRSASVTLS
jgi:hypothetical protein